MMKTIITQNGVPISAPVQAPKLFFCNSCGATFQSDEYTDYIYTDDLTNVTTTTYSDFCPTCAAVCELELHA